VPGRLIFHVIKIGRSARAGKVTAMENGLKPGWLALPDQVDLFHTRRAAPATPASPIEIPARFLVGTRFLFSFRTMLIFIDGNCFKILKFVGSLFVLNF
jgi:hypothetical protein